MKAYLCLVTWADGTEGLLFPRPGNVRIADTKEHGLVDFKTACEHLLAHKNYIRLPVSIRLFEFERGPELASMTVE